MPQRPPGTTETNADTEGAAVAAAEALLQQGEPLLAYNAVQEARARWPESLRLRQLEALALARSGDPERAHAILEALVAAGHGDAETLGILARTHKDLALRALEPAARERHLREGHALYARAFAAARERRAPGDAIYTGINAATMAVLLGDLGEARRLAREVRAICLDDASGAAGGYWREATLGEAALILGDDESAAAHYGAAARLAAGRHGDLATTRKQARLLAGQLPGSAAAVAEALRIPPVLVYTGHMLDAPGRAAPRFPPALEGAVRAALRERLAALAPAAAYGSAACGADLLCLELVRELGGETHVVLPFPPAEFRAASVDFAGGDWGARFERALAAAASVTVTSDHRASGSAATFEYANLVLTGMARLRAQLLDTTLQGLVVRDPRSPGAAGGAASLAELWQAAALPVESIDIARLQEGQATRPLSASGRLHGEAAREERSDAALSMRHEMRALLFADAVGYSKLTEDQIPLYVEGFLGAVADLCRRTAHRHQHVEVAGDGLYMVFGRVADAGYFALELADLVRGLDRAALGLPGNFGLRIALHCGPVHCGRDPITGGPLYTGPHTSRTARIEPITPPGQVYASSAFAAVAAAEGVPGLDLRYVGRIPLAKGYGTLGLYNVRAGG